MLNWLLAPAALIFTLGFALTHALGYPRLSEASFIIAVLLCILGCFLNSTYWKLKRAFKIGSALDVAVGGKGPCIQIEYSPKRNNPDREYSDYVMVDLIQALLPERRSAVLEAHNAIMQLKPLATKYVAGAGSGQWNCYLYKFGWFIVTFWLNLE